MGYEDHPDAAWRERAVERSLRTARARAVTRAGRFLDAARSLLAETDAVDFTVQEVIDRSKLSLRAFYQHFGSKDELLLALFEEIVREFVTDLRREVETQHDPVEQLRAYVIGLFDRADRAASPGSRALTAFHLGLAQTRPDDYGRAVAPQIDLLVEIIERGVAAGAFRTDVEPATLAVLLSEVLISAAHMSVLGVQMTGTRLTADQLWAFCLSGTQPPAPTPKRRRGRSR